MVCKTSRRSLRLSTISITFDFVVFAFGTLNPFDVGNCNLVISIPYVQRMELINPLIENITIKGSVDSFVAITDILALCDTNTLVSALTEEFGYG